MPPSQHANYVKQNCLEYFVEKSTLYLAGCPTLSRMKIDAELRAEIGEAYLQVVIYTRMLLRFS